jgi:hypothetical protein
MPGGFEAGVSMPNLRLQRVEKGYTFLREHSSSGTSFTAKQMAAVTGWSLSSVKTYITKQWSDFLVPGGQGEYRVRTEFRRVTYDSFLELITQKRRVYSKYRRVEYSSVVQYEFLLPLTKENQLTDALDSLFYTDTISRRLEEIGLDEVQKWVPAEPNEDAETY